MRGAPFKGGIGVDARGDGAVGVEWGGGGTGARRPHFQHAPARPIRSFQGKSRQPAARRIRSGACSRPTSAGPTGPGYFFFAWSFASSAWESTSFFWRSAARALASFT
jgi:hypothetical protein